MKNPAITKQDRNTQSLFESQEITQKILHLSRSEANPKEFLHQSLRLILSASWLGSSQKGGIFIKSEHAEVLELVASVNLDPEIESTCAQVRFGHCLCGLVAQNKTLRFTPCRDKSYDPRLKNIPPRGQYNVPIMDKKQEVLGVLVVYLPYGHQENEIETSFLAMISDLIGALVEFKKSRDELRLLKSSISRHMVVSRSDSDGNITYANEKFCKVSGYSQQELIGQNHRMLNSGYHKPEVFAAMYKQLARRGIWSGTLRNKAKNGSFYWVETTIIAVKNLLGKPDGHFSVRKDITKLHTQQQELANKNRELELAMENMSHGLCYFDADDHLIGCNRKYAQIYNLPESLTAHGTPYIDILKYWKENNHHFTGNHNKYFTNKKLGSMAPRSWKTTDKTNDNQYIEVAFQRLEDGCWLSTHSDVSEKVLRERDLISAKNEALAGTKEKSEFLSIISHELRTPLNGVLGVASLLGTSDLDEEQQKLLGIIRQSGESLLRTINSIFDYKKMDGGKVRLCLEPFDLEETLKEIVDLYAPKAAEKGVDLVFDFPRAPQAKLMGDQKLIKVVVANLVENAVKFTDEGRVEIAASCTESDGLIAVEITVKDTGIGIKVSEIANIFKAFSQENSTDTRKNGGAGLGLSIANKIAGLLEGSLDVTSTPGEGADFRFALKLAYAGT